jgi:hypothetical protein
MQAPVQEEKRILEHLWKSLSMACNILVHDFVDVIASLTEEIDVLWYLNTKNKISPIQLGNHYECIHEQ